MVGISQPLNTKVLRELGTQILDYSWWPKTSNSRLDFFLTPLLSTSMPCINHQIFNSLKDGRASSELVISSRFPANIHSDQSAHRWFSIGWEKQHPGVQGDEQGSCLLGIFRGGNMLHSSGFIYKLYSVQKCESQDQKFRGWEWYWWGGIVCWDGLSPVVTILPWLQHRSHLAFVIKLVIAMQSLQSFECILYWQTFTTTLRGVEKIALASEKNLWDFSI